MPRDALWQWKNAVKYGRRGIRTRSNNTSSAPETASAEAAGITTHSLISLSADALMHRSNKVLPLFSSGEPATRSSSGNGFINNIWEHWYHNPQD